MAKHKSIRLDDQILRLITQRMIDEQCDESTAIRGLIIDGGKAERPLPIQSQLGTSEDLKKFGRLMMEWQQSFQSVRARLSIARPDPQDKELDELVSKWRSLAADLEPRARTLSNTADALSRVLMGLSYDDIEDLAKFKRLLAVIQQRIIEQRKTTDAPEEKERAEDKFSYYEVALRMLSLLGI